MEFPILQFVPCVQFSIHSSVHLSNSYFISSSVSGFTMTSVSSFHIHANIVSGFMDLFVSSLFKYSGTSQPEVSCHWSSFPTALSNPRFPKRNLPSKNQGDGGIKYLGHLQIFDTRSLFRSALAPHFPTECFYRNLAVCRVNLADTIIWRGTPPCTYHGEPCWLRLSSLSTFLIHGLGVSYCCLLSDN